MVGSSDELAGVPRVVIAFIMRAAMSEGKPERGRGGAIATPV